jgi:hypothetical protein
MERPLPRSSVSPRSPAAGWSCRVWALHPARRRPGTLPAAETLSAAGAYVAQTKGRVAVYLREQASWRVAAPAPIL